MINILAYSPEKGFFEPGPESLSALLKDNSILKWIDFDNPTNEEVRVLSDVFRFHPLAIEDCLSFVPNPKIDDYVDYLYVVIHGINAEALKRDELETHDLDIFLGKDYLVTFHKGFFRSIALIKERCRKNPSILAGHSEALMHKIIDSVIDNYLPIMDDFGEDIDAIEKEIFAKPTKKTPEKLLALKKDLLYLRRIVHPQREILRQLSGGEYKQICLEDSFHFKDIYDHIFMVSELIETYRDSITSSMDVYLSIVSNRLNQIMKVLTIIATIMLPLTLISGIYGMNFAYMPLKDSPYGFFILMGIMALIGIGMLWFF